MKQASRAQVEGMRWPILEPLDGALRPVALSKPVCVAGARSCVNLTLASPLISRSHALFVQDSDAVYVRDLASRNHIYVNDTRVRESVISNGDVLRIGPFSFRFENRFADSDGAPKVEFPPLHLTIDGKRILLSGRTGVIGSRDDCDVYVDDAQVDEVHSVLFERHGQWFVRDLPSSTGTFVNDNPVVESEIKTGDTIRVGDTNLLCNVGEVDDQVLTPDKDDFTETIDNTLSVLEEGVEKDELPAVGLDRSDSDLPGIGLAEQESSDLISLAPAPLPEPPEISPATAQPITVAVKVRHDDGIITRPVDSTEDSRHDFAAVFAGAAAAPQTHLLEAPMDALLDVPTVVRDKHEDSAPVSEEQLVDPEASAEPAADAPEAHPETQAKQEVLTTLLHELSENLDKVQSTWDELKAEAVGETVGQNAGE